MCVGGRGGGGGKSVPGKRAGVGGGVRARLYWEGHWPRLRLKDVEMVVNCVSEGWRLQREYRPGACKAGRLCCSLMDNAILFVGS